MNVRLPCYHATALVRASFQPNNTIFQIVTITKRAFSPTMNKRLYAVEVTIFSVGIDISCHQRQICHMVP